MHEFDYVRVASVDEAASLVREDDEAKLLAGGMTLLPALKLRLAQPTQLLDLGGIPDLTSITSDENSVTVAAMATHASVAESAIVQAHIPALAKLAGNIGDAQVRNRGTLGGSIANADPAADYPAALVGLNAIVLTDQRKIAADDFFVDLFETALHEDEVITAVEFPIPDRASYMKFPNPASRYAIVGVFIAEASDGVRVAVTGAGESVFRWRDCEAALQRDTTTQAIDALSLSTDELNEDIHASAEYRAHLVKVMASRALKSMLS